MAVYVKGHLNRAVPEKGLKPLWREASLDRPRGKEVAERVNAVFRFHRRVAVLILLVWIEPRDPHSMLQRIEAAIRDICMVLDVAVAVGENQPQAPPRPPPLLRSAGTRNAIPSAR
jgi:hypothetical protein